MLFREFGKTGENLSILGFGIMRLPIIDNDSSKIDEEKAIKMIRHAIDNGVNYLDTAYVYHGCNSEAFTAKVMKDGYREKVNVATKLPTWDVEQESDLVRLLEEQRSNLGVETIDFYLMHSLNKTHFATISENNYKPFLDKAKKDGKIKYAGFSFHDNIDLFKEIVDDYDWDFCQIQLNYLDENYQAGIDGLEYAASKGLGVIIMEPLRGGMLAKEDMPEAVESEFKKSYRNISPAAWALKYLWNKKEVGIVLSGMNTMANVVDNLATASTSEIGSLTQDDVDIIDNVKKYFKANMAVNCTSCRYCMPCPYGVDIPENFWGINHDMLFNDFGKGKFWITGALPEASRADKCVSCGQCIEQCPQNINIPVELEKVAERYGLK